MQHQPDVQQGEGDDADEQAEQHQAVHVDVAVGVEHRGLLVQAPPQANAPVHERDLHHRDQSEHGTAFRALFVAATEPTDRQVADVGDEEQRGGREAGIPLPEDAPGESTPHRTDCERDRDECDTDLGAGTRGTVPSERLLLGEEVHRR